jgi:hypothetical protein
MINNPRNILILVNQMAVSIFFVVHDEDSFEKHPDLIGFGVKTTLIRIPFETRTAKLFQKT